MAKENLQKEVKLKTKELEEKNKRLENMTLTDPLTGLGNRVKLKQTFESICSQLGQEIEHISVLMIDIDYFKDYNDFYGHLQGDEVLQKIGSFILEEILHTNITAIRFGGEEFCLILPSMDEQKAIATARNINLKIKELLLPHDKSTVSEFVTVTIGVHTITANEETEECTLIEIADKALYKAKKAGRDQVCYL